MSEFSSEATAPAAETTADTSTESYAPDTTPEVTTEPSVEASAPGTPPEAAPDSAPAFDPSTLPPEIAPHFADYETHRDFRSQYEPWLNDLGGREAIETDLRVLGAAFSEDANDRFTNFHRAMYDASPQAYQRILDDFVAVPYIEEQILNRHGISFDEQGGLLVNGQPVAPPAPQSEQVQTVLQSLKPEHVDVFKSLDPEVQEDLALQSEKVRNFNLENYATTYRIQQQQEADRRSAAQRMQQEAKQLQIQRENQLYNDVRNTIKESLKTAFPDEADLNLILNNTETEFFNSIEGDAGWAELKDLLAKGEMRAAKAKLPGVIAKAQALATKHSQSYSQKLEQARMMQGLVQQFGQDGVGQVKELLNLLASGDTDNAQTYFQRLALAARARERREPGVGNTAATTRQPSARRGEPGSYDPEDLFRYQQAAFR